ncbi:MAG: SusC/RagA family TonB-linked outer membrane protein [Candidatus Pseudobacter hemicellulosilyticus]|uniref:SusC/RagA family TonB-linked outer membrane protein n=1 Tax=Candidatus Pseudobacter hemicellulosilyticus TaxID=3121375 RepID=A0AAJ6BJI0_9BACT|nr:MAG: SusC/RagA family TonB-linked outer membrane protein [Pseudobacter sp.]
MKKLFIKGFAVLFLSLLLVDVTAQQQKEVKAKKETAVLKGRIVDDKGNPVANASITSGEGAIVHYTDKNGHFRFQAKSEIVLLIEHAGFEPVTIDLKEQSLPGELVLMKAALLTGTGDWRERPDGGPTVQRYFTGAISKVQMDLVKKYPDLTINNAMQGQASGLIARPNNGGIGYNSADLFIRGRHGMGDNQAMVVIDGIQRPMADITPEEIESIEIMKDAVAKIIFGPAAANGVINIRTRRGVANKGIIRATVESGVMQSDRDPEYLNAYNYAQLYNEARRNDGMPDYYLPYQLEGYRNSKGNNDLLYPDVDWYNYFIGPQSAYRKAAVEFFGGNKNVKYAMVVGYTGSSGLEKVGKRSDLNRLNIRGNLDMIINEYMTAHADVAGRMEIKDWGKVDGAGIFNTIATRKPNEYPFVIDAAAIGLAPGDDGIPYFGTSDRYSDNLYADLTYGGNTSERYINSQTNLGLDFNFNKFLKGFKAGAYITFDNYSYLLQQLSNTYPTYAVQPYLDASGQEQLLFTQKRKLTLEKDQLINNNEIRRTNGWRANISYERSFGQHDLSAAASYRYFKDERKGLVQDVIEANYNLRLNYMYAKKYILEADAAYMGSNKFVDDQKYFPSGAVGAAWIISEESFFNFSRNIDFLKLKTSYGILGFSANTAADLYRSAWRENSTIGFNEQNVSQVYITSLTRVGNPDLRWESAREWNIGLEGIFFNKRLSGELNYFSEKRKDIIGVGEALYNAYIGNYTKMVNMGSAQNRGLDLQLTWQEKRTGDFSFAAGLNITYSKSKLLAWNELSNKESYRQAVGQPVGALFGLQALGLFGKEVNLKDHPFQTFGPYQNGDIAYADLNNDGVIDSRDETVIGNDFPSWTFGAHVELQYKQWGLYVQGTAEADVSRLLNSTYYWNTGEGNYSAMVLDRYHETANPNGSYPRLTTTNGANSYRNSSFWLKNSAFFRLKNVELSYTFVNRNGVGFYKRLKLFARGTNLLLLTGFKDLDPERPLAGIYNYPTYRGLTGGLTVSF